uniref:HAT C-terminal dimerisation domain-containing protein n=1 Tax=Amphiprion percula TaxID=161767 RepID=A0A3P8T1D6_AMPPE
MANTKKRKVDFENHQFKSDWTDHFCFILPDHAKAKPTCLICMQTVAVCKTDNLKRHFNTMHAASFNANYPPESDQRKQKIANMITSYKHSVSTISKSTSAQESATAASLQVSWNLAKAKKPFADGELTKSCAVAMVSEVLRHDEKQKKTVVELLKQVPLSANTATRRVEVLAVDSIDSSCDRTDMEQLSVFARFFDGKTFREELLCLLPLTGRTTGEIIFTEPTQFFVKNGLDVGKIVSIVTDGAPSMVGQHKGLVSRLSAVNPALLAFHCIIHKSVLCAKLLVNFIRESSSLQHGLFRAMLDEMSAEHKDVLLHNDVRWLSKGRVMNCHPLIYPAKSKSKNHTLKLHFPRLREHCEKNNMGEDQVMQDFVSSLAKNFYERFECTPKLSSDILLFLRQPFSVSADGQWTAEAKKLWPSIDEAALQMEVLEMGTSDVLKAQHRDVGVNDCWINMVPQARFRNTRAIAMLLLTMFPSTYICESSFSSMNSIKNQDRNRLSNAHLDQCLRIVTTEYRPDIRSIASSQCCHFSH